MAAEGAMEVYKVCEKIVEGQGMSFALINVIIALLILYLCFYYSRFDSMEAKDP